jgi:hypothetical protein
MSREKQCVRCGEVKDEEDFYSDKRAVDGKNSHCKACHNLQSRQNRAKNPGKRKLEDAIYRANSNPEKRRLQQYSWVRANPEKRRQIQQKWRGKYPEKSRAHEAVKRAIRSGVLVRPEKCQRCGKQGRVEGSHDDYAKPLAVEWLCVSCHREKDGQTGLVGEIRKALAGKESEAGK